MRILYVTGSCLTKNTSANMSHNGFVKGLIDNGAEIDIIMPKDSWGNEDSVLKKWSGINYYEYNSFSIHDRFRIKAGNAVLKSEKNNLDRNRTNKNFSFKKLLRAIVKKIFYTMFPNDPLYPLEKKWLKTALNFKNKKTYDLVISNSSPAAGHKLAGDLLAKKRIQSKRWIQIWEDPWFYDLYGGHSELIKNEEHRLLKLAQEIYYVSPLTLMYQKKYFSDCKDKMKCVPLPYFEINESSHFTSERSFGYFGDYYSHTRNLKPFYEALKRTGYKGYIYGDSDENFLGADNIEISSRVTLDKLSKVQNKTGILVHLCNLQGGQIPGKIYHYSATKKPILFILDGTEEEKICIKDFFGKYNRYYFCENTVDSIMNGMEALSKEKKVFSPVLDFSPVEVTKLLLEKK